MKCHAQLEARRLVAPLLICLLLSGPANAAVADNSNRPRLNGFAVEGVALGMSIERILEIYPAAKIEREAANCYSYGRAISVPELTRRVLRLKRDEGELTLNFEPPYAGGRLSRIYFDRSVDLSTFDFGKLLDGLSKRYGAYERILHRRKMEPAGRIVGFEWLGADDATLRVVLRNDHHNRKESIRLSYLANSAVRDPHPVRRAPSPLCGKPRPLSAGHSKP